MPLVSIQIANRTMNYTCGDGGGEGKSGSRNWPLMSTRKSANCASSSRAAPDNQAMVFASLIRPDESREARGWQAAESATSAAPPTAPRHDETALEA